MAEIFHQKYGTWALVLGAAQGLGEAFSRQLAGRGVNVLMVDVQQSKLTRAAEAVREEYKVETRVLVLDLEEKRAVPTLMEAMEALPDCRLAIYCAAYGPVKMFLENEPEELDRYLDVNARNLLQLSHAFSRRLIAGSQTGGMIFISSFTGLWGTTLVAPYGATKAFDWNLGEALNYELKTFGIDVLSVCSGAMSTPNYLATQPDYGRLKPKVYDPAYVARKSLEKLGKKAFFIPGFSNRLVYFLFGRLFPRAWGVKIMNDTMRRMYHNRWKPGPATWHRAGDKTG